MMYWYGYGSEGATMGPLMWVLTVVFWVAVILFFIWTVREIVGHAHLHGVGHERAIDILKERYAKGEITKEEYVEKRKDLLS